MKVGISMLIAVVAVIATSWLIASQNFGVDETMYIVFFVLSIVVPLVAIVVRSLRMGYIDVLHPAGLVPLTFGIIYSSAPFFLADEAGEASAITVATALSLGLVAYYAGALVARLWLSQPAGPVRLVGMPEPQLRANVLYLTFAVGAGAMLVFWARAGGIPILKGDLENSRIDALTGSGVPFYFSMLLMVATWLSFSPRSEVPPRMRVLMLLAGAGLLATTGWRNTIFALIVVAVLTVHYSKPFRARNVFMAAGVTVVAATYLGLLRIVSSNLNGYASYRALASGDVLGATYIYLTDYADAFSRNLATVFATVPTNLSFQGGSTLIWNFLSLAPGSELEPFDFVLKRAAGAGFSGGGLPATLVGEWYVNFGWTGIAVGMVFVGMVAAFGYASLVRGAKFRTKLISVVIIYYIFVSVRGGIGNVLLTLTWLILATMVIDRLARRDEVPNLGALENSATRRFAPIVGDTPPRHP